MHLGPNKAGPGPSRNAGQGMAAVPRSNRSMSNSTRGRDDRSPGTSPGATMSMEAGSLSEGLEAQMAAALNHQMESPNLGSLSLQQNTLMISACGRTVEVDMKQANSLLDLQGALQRILVMEGQLFHFFDLNGNTLQSDAQVVEAIGRGQTPLCATLTDASIHYIENRREELAQMQWKLVRDQMTGASGKTASLARNFSELQHGVEDFKSEMRQFMDRTRNELFRAVETERDVANSEMKQLAERVNAIAQLVSGERNKREATVAGIEKSIQGIRDMFDNERNSHRQDMNQYMAVFQEAKASVAAETTSREAFEDRHSFDMLQVKERTETVGKHFAELLQDQVQFFRKSTEECSGTLQQQNRLVLRVRSELDESTRKTEIQLTQCMASIAEFHTRCESVEHRIAESAVRQASTLSYTMDKHEKNLQSQVAQATKDVAQQAATSLLQGTSSYLVGCDTSNLSTMGGSLQAAPGSMSPIPPHAVGRLTSVGSPVGTSNLSITSGSFVNPQMVPIMSPKMGMNPRHSFPAAGSSRGGSMGGSTRAPSPGAGSGRQRGYSIGQPMPIGGQPMPIGQGTQAMVAGVAQRQVSVPAHRPR